MSTNSANMFDMDLQNLFLGELLPGQTHDTGIVEQGPKIKAIMDELEQQYIRVRDDLQRGCFTVSAMWDADRKLPIVYQDDKHADTLTALMVYHASQNASRDLSFFIPGSSGRIRPCDSACTTLFVGLYKHIYRLSSSGSVVPTPNEPANAEEERVLDTIVTSCQRVGFLPAHPCPAQVKEVKTESLYLLRRTEAEMFTGQLIMARVMVHHQPDITVHKDDHDEDPGAASGGHGGNTFTQRDQPTDAAVPSHVAGQTYTGSHTGPVRTRLVLRSRTPSASLPTESGADDGSTANNTSNRASSNRTMDQGYHVFRLHLNHWMPIETQGSMASRFNVAASPSFVNTGPGEFDVADASKLSEPTHKRRQIANIASLDGAYSSPESSDDDDNEDDDVSSIATDDYDADVDVDAKNTPLSLSSRRRRRLAPSRSSPPQSKTTTAITIPSSSSPSAASTSPASSPPRDVSSGPPITGPNGFRTLGPLPRFTASGVDQSHNLVFRYYKNGTNDIPLYHEQHYFPRGALKHGIDWASEAHMATLNRWAAQLALRLGKPRSRGDMKEREWVAEETAFLRELAERFAAREDGGRVVRRKELYRLFNERFGDKEVEVTGKDGVKRVMKRFWRSDQALTGHVDRTGAFAALKGKWGRVKKGGDDVVEGAGADDDDGVEDGVGQDGSGDGVAVDDEALAEDDVMLGM
ncbi:hypothetical protein SLS54_009821 [Diplodia seriata]